MREVTCWVKMENINEVSNYQKYYMELESENVLSFKNIF